MTTKQVLKLAAVFLNKQELLPAIEGSEEIDTTTQHEFDILLNSLNLCYQEIALDYMPLLTQEYVLIENYKIYTQDLQREIKDVYSLHSLDGSKNYKFKMYDNYIQTNVNGNLNIVYSYIPDQITLDDDINNFAGRISLKCLAMGTVAEYCYIQGLYEDATLWEQRYKNLLKVETRKKSEIKLPTRRWL